ncbi:hypothetical protein ROSINTL182_08735 [Roseburia intestinalis L1-82]|uniref:Uncharacterized protein n=1 Tax=Roseburia intestinalis L1-82 TaxID=536231 RepID=C7GFM8_9FIRM|nr:hypothetical protein ROSINTL182_08735 [Roseburia intestinalis L1-82]
MGYFLQISYNFPPFLLFFSLFAIHFLLYEERLSHLRGEAALES